MKILFTGMSGYVGKNFLRKIAELKGHNIVCYSRKKIKGVKTIIGDLSDQNLLNKSLRGVNVVVHMASETSEDDLDKLYLTNVEGTKNLVNAARINKVRRFIYLSSASVLFALHNDYPQSKKMAEDVIKKSMIRYAILRPSEIYGGIDSKHYLQHINTIKKNRIAFFSEGSHLVQPVYVGDVVSALIKIIKNDKYTGTYVVAGRKPIKNSELYGLMRDRFNKNCRLVFVPNALAFVAIKMIFPLLGKKRSWKRYLESVESRTYRSDFKSLGFEEGVNYL